MEYLDVKNITKLKVDLEDEIQRAKQIINESGYDNSTAFNNIVRNYRRELKQFLKTVTDDYDNIIEMEFRRYLTIFDISALFQSCGVTVRQLEAPTGYNFHGKTIEAGNNYFSSDYENEIRIMIQENNIEEVYLYRVHWEIKDGKERINVRMHKVEEGH